MFKHVDCLVCKEKDSRISDLKEQIEYFKNVLNPPRKPFQYEEPSTLQEDMLLDGGGKEETELPQSPLESAEVLLERERMLAGTY